MKTRFSCLFHLTRYNQFSIFTSNYYSHSHHHYQCCWSAFQLSQFILKTEFIKQILYFGITIYHTMSSNNLTTNKLLSTMSFSRWVNNILRCKYSFHTIKTEKCSHVRYSQHPFVWTFRIIEDNMPLPVHADIGNRGTCNTWRQNSTKFDVIVKIWENKTRKQ